MAIIDRLKGAWNAFRSNDQEIVGFQSNIGPSYGSRPDRPRLSHYNERSIVTSIYNRMSIDIASISLRHVLLDDKGRYKEEIKSGLNSALNFEPNLDQGPSSFRQDIAMTLFDNGSAAIVPVDVSFNPTNETNYDIYTLRVGKIVAWYPNHVKVSLYNQKIGQYQEITLEKRFVAIVENPLYAVMNEPNSTLQRLIRKLSILDSVDEATGSGKLDLIIQLPYTVKSTARKELADQRRVDIEMQLKDSQYGIAWTDATEKITQLNRPAENNLLKQIEYLANMLYGQLGLTEDVMNGTADEATMINYYNRAVEPVVRAVAEAMQRSFIGHTATIDGGQRVLYFRDPFRLVPISQIANIANSLSRNEIVTSNEIRGVIGFAPHPDPKADKLENSNMPPKVDDSTDVA